MSQRLQAMQRIFGGIVALSSLITLPPMVIAHLMGEASRNAFFESFLLVGLVLGNAGHSVLRIPSPSTPYTRAGH